MVLELPVHRFDKAADRQVLTVDLPSLSSLDGVDLDIGETELRLQLPESQSSSRIPLPPEVAGYASVAKAKFSKKRLQLTVTWPVGIVQEEKKDAVVTEEVEEEVVIEELENDSAQDDEDEVVIEELDNDTAAAPSAPALVVPSPQPLAAVSPAASLTGPKDAAYGSLWNANSWHWEEKNCIEVAQNTVRWALETCSSRQLSYVKPLKGCSVVLSDVATTGEAGMHLRRGKRFLCFELGVSFKWAGRDEFGSALGVKGTGTISDVTQDAGSLPSVAIETSAYSVRTDEAKALGEWLKRAGAKLIAASLEGDVLSAAMLAAATQNADAKADRERRSEELVKANDARVVAGAEQARIATELRRIEEDRRSIKPVPADAVQGSVWNANAWHWEEKPMTPWSVAWLERELGTLRVPLMGGAGYAVLQEVKVSGDASVSVRKGKLIPLFQLQIECQWIASVGDPGAEGIGATEARGRLKCPEVASEDGAADCSIEIAVASDKSPLHRLSASFRSEGQRAVRGVLARFARDLREQGEQKSAKSSLSTLTTAAPSA